MLITVLRGAVTDLKGVASVEWRHFPTHAPDPALHVAGLGFEGDHFWGFTFRVVAAVYAAGGQFDGLTPAKLEEFAKAEGGSATTLEAAYADQAKWAAVKEDLMAGKLLGVTRTPGLFYNGYFMTPNGIPGDLKAFDKSLREMLTHK
jgi:protein-disulfide isomerase